VAEEEVHGGVEARVQSDEQDDEQVPQHCGQVHAQEQGKEDALLLCLDGEPQEEELGYAALVLPPHAPLLSAGMNGEQEKQKPSHYDFQQQIKGCFSTAEYAKVCLHCQNPTKIL